MVSKRFTEEFKLEAIKQITERHFPVAEVSAKLGVSTHSLYAWVKKYSQPKPVRLATDNQQATIKRLQSQLKRVTEELDILKRPPRTLPENTGAYYAWRTSPTSVRQREDIWLLGLIKQFWLESGGVYDYRKVADDMPDTGKRCSR